MKQSIYVLYLQFETKLDERFFNLSNSFNHYGISLIPITPAEFKQLPMTGHEYVMAVIRDMNSLKEYRALLKRYLNYCVRNGKATLFELSSFETNQDLKFIKEQKVFVERLPITIFQLIDIVGRKIYNDLMNSSKKWPGGRRARLPSA